MFKNYFKIAVRNLLRYKGFSLINIFSLALGITGCLAIGLFVWDEWQFDKQVSGGEHIYRLYGERSSENATTYGASVPPVYADFIQQQYPEVDTTARIMMITDRFLLETENKQAYEDKGWFVDPSFFHLFSLKFSKGDPSTALSAPDGIVLTQELAEKYFGKEDPLGKVLFINKDTLQVRGVLASLPSHFHLDFRYLMPIAALNLPKERMQSWGWQQFYTYVKLKPGANVQQLEGKLITHIKNVIQPREPQNGSTFLPRFQHLHDIHLKSADFAFDKAIRGNESYVKALTIIALFVLLIAVFNFINLATARSLRRAKEIGVRKVIGADRKQLVLQFIGETVLLALIAMILSIIATMLLVPLLNAFTGKTITFNPIGHPLLGLALLAAGVLIGALAGVYPAFVLSGFQPIKVLKSAKQTNSSGSLLRPALVVVQFTLSVLLIVCTLIVYRQTRFMNNKDLGFSKEQVLYFNIQGDVSAKLETFKSELRRMPNVIGVTSGYGLPGDAFAGDGIKLPTADGVKDQAANVFIGDHDYVKTLGLHIVAGRDFSREHTTDVRQAFLINETAVKTLGFGSPQQALGKDIYWEEWAPADTTDRLKKGKVIGVVQDFHYKSLHEKVTTSVIQLYPQIASTICVKLKGADMQSSIASITNLWKQFAPAFPFDYKFMDESYGKMYSSEEKLSDLLWIFAIVSIVVGCMGLFGLAAFTAEQRTKEIGIRKVLGASTVHIMGLLSKNFVVLVFIASFIAFPLAWWAMNNWLDDFPYRVGMSWWIFALALLAALAIALITVSFQSIKAATANPVGALRNE